MGLYDIELPSTPRSPRFRMIGRGVGDVRRRALLISLAACLLVMFLIGARRNNQVKDWVDYNRFDSQFQLRSASYAFSSRILSGATVPLTKGDAGPVLGKGERTLSRQSLMDLRNDTLGFGNVWVVNMEKRTDKLDAMRLTSSLTGFKFDVLPAIDGARVDKKALTKEWDFPTPGNAEGRIGCWRSHMNFALKIIENNLASGLIMEDDIDWDVSLRSQLELVALGSQSLLSSPKKSDPFSPYGDGWDILWLGHCASQPANDEHRRFLIKNDPTTAPPEARVNYGDIPDMTAYGNRTRMMYFTKGSTCTYAYGLSYHGAQKMLKWLSMDVYNKPIDFGLHDMCSKPNRGFKCIGVFPQLFAEYKSAGPASKDSDIVPEGPETPTERKNGFSFNIVHSTRSNADALIDGKADNVTTKWLDGAPELTAPIETELRNDPVQNTPDPTDNDADD